MLTFLRTFPEYLVEQNTFQKAEHLNVASGTAEAAACSQSFVDTEYLRAFSSARLLLSEHVHQIHGERLNARTLLVSRQQCSSSLHRPVTRRPQAVFGCVLMGTSRIKQQEKSLRRSDECSKIIGSVCKDSRKTAWKIVEICWYFSDSVLILLNLFTELRDYQNMSFENARCHEAENIQLNAGEKGQSFRL